MQITTPVRAVSITKDIMLCSNFLKIKNSKWKLWNFIEFKFKLKRYN